MYANSPYAFVWLICIAMISYTFWWGLTNLVAIQSRFRGPKNHRKKEILGYTVIFSGMIAVLTALGGLFAGVATGTFAVRFDWALPIAVIVQVVLYFFLRLRLAQWRDHEKSGKKPLK